MTEGCSGGWATMHGYFAEAVGLVSETCAPYKGDTSGSCSHYQQCKPIAKITKSRHLGKKITEEDIQREIMTNGAVITDWNPPSFFQVYRSGILTDQSLVQSHSTNLAQTPDEQDRRPSHASVLIGWGVGKGNQKYWIMRNT